MNKTIKDNLREIRKEFFAFRNGIVADKLRKAGDPHPVIMGCLLVDVQAIAQRTREAIDDPATLARELWADTNSRECRLAAPMFYPPDQMPLEEAMQWCQSVETVEVADNLCHKLLRHIPDADALWRQLIVKKDTLVRYTGYRLLMNLLLLNKVERTPQLKAAIQTEADNSPADIAVLIAEILEDF